MKRNRTLALVAVILMTAATLLGWQAGKEFSDIVRDMVEADYTKTKMKVG